jgi:hypothetical protein
LHFYGFVRYSDIYGQIWRINIHRRWVVQLGVVLSGQITNWWEAIGPTEENAEIREEKPD